MSDGEKSGPDRGMSDRQKSLGKCAMPKQLVMTQCFFARAPSRQKSTIDFLIVVYALKRLFRKQAIAAAVVVTTQVKKSGKVQHRLRHAEVHQRGHLLAQVSSN